MDIYLSEEFRKDYAKIKDEVLKERVFKALEKLSVMLERGKPLRYGHKGERRLRIGPFRVLYCIEGEGIGVLCFEHRGKVY